MNFEQPPKPSEEKETFYAGVKKLDGTIDKSQSAIFLDPEGKLAKQFEDSRKKEEREIKEGFDWEKTLKARFYELLKIDRRQGLSEHGDIEFNRLSKVMEALREK